MKPEWVFEVLSDPVFRFSYAAILSQAAEIHPYYCDIEYQLLLAELEFII